MLTITTPPMMSAMPMFEAVDAVGMRFWRLWAVGLRGWTGSGWRSILDGMSCGFGTVTVSG